MNIFTLIALAPTVQAQEVLFQEDVRGGVSVDATAADASLSGSATLVDGLPFELQIPSTATVTHAYLILQAKLDGFATTTTEGVQINGYPLTVSTLLTTSARTETYELDPVVFEIESVSGDGAISVDYQEDGAVEDGFHAGRGISGATLAVVYEDLSLLGHRHVVIAADDLSTGDSVFTDLPAADAVNEAIVSYGITYECSNDQSSIASIDGIFISTNVGGRDDGPTHDGYCGSQDWNSLITQGSFGYDDTDDVVGTDGDDPDFEPLDGTATNSRLSDELFRVDYSRSGDLSVGYIDSSEDSRLTSVVVVIELDQDGDGIEDSLDNCPEVYNPDQLDTDGDGIGDACDECTDEDGDGFGIPTDATSTCSDADCDDSDPAINPDATEIWYDGIDQNCDGASDYDQDGDGFDSDAFGGIDCDDVDASINPDASETWYDGVDQNCDGACDYDADADTCPHEDYYEESLLSGPCDTTCFTSSDDEPTDTGEGSGDTGDTDDTGDTEDTGGADTGDAEDTGAESSDTGEAGSTEVVVTGGDCDDLEPTALPGEVEIWYDGIDQDCDGNDTDQDGDGYDGIDAGGDDCDDLNPDINPGAEEIWYDEIDQDCDGNDADTDGDGFDAVEYGGPDCDDSDATVNPDAEEIWYDGVDQDCDGLSDYDQDGDGYNTSEDFGGPTGDDCDDLNDLIHPGVSEIWYDGIDQDCDGASDYDQDGDGHDVIQFGGDDCDDSDASINPSMDETWYDGIDSDCDGAHDNDADGDSYTFDDDCDDLDPEFYPNAPGFSDCEPIIDSTVTYKGGGCSHTRPTPTGFLVLLAGLLMGVRRRD